MAEETPAVQQDWIAALVDSLIEYVDMARTLGTENIVRVVRAVVFGLVALVFGIAAVVSIVIILVRVADAYLPIGSGVGSATWAAFLFIGVMVTTLGFGLWLSRRVDHWRRLTVAIGIDVVIFVVIVCYGIFA